MLITRMGQMRGTDGGGVDQMLRWGEVLGHKCGMDHLRAPGLVDLTGWFRTGLIERISQDRRSWT